MTRVLVSLPSPLPHPPTPKKKHNLHTQKQQTKPQQLHKSSGRLAEQTPIARQQGTTVQVTHLFAPLPVRRAEFQRTVSRHSARLLRVLQGYALVARGVRLACSNVKGGKGNR